MMIGNQLLVPASQFRKRSSKIGELDSELVHGLQRACKAIRERTGEQVAATRKTRHHVIIAQISIVEVVAALRKRFRQGDISEFASYQARKRFITHIAKQQFRVIDMSSEIVD